MKNKIFALLLIVFLTMTSFNVWAQEGENTMVGTVISVSYTPEDGSYLLNVMNKNENLLFEGTNPVIVQKGGFTASFPAIYPGAYVTVSYTDNTAYMVSMAQTTQNDSYTFVPPVYTNSPVVYQYTPPQTTYQTPQTYYEAPAASNNTDVYRAPSEAGMYYSSTTGNAYYYTPPGQSTDYTPSYSYFNPTNTSSSKTTYDTKGDVVSINDHRISLKQGTSAKKTFFMMNADNVDIYINGKSADIDDLVSAYEKNDKVTATVTAYSQNDRVIEIDASTKKSSGSGSNEEFDDDDEIDGEITYISRTKLKIKGYKDYCYIDDYKDVYVDVDDDDDDTIDDIKGLIDADDDGKTMDVTVVIEDGYVTEITGEVTDWDDDDDDDDDEFDDDDEIDGEITYITRTKLKLRGYSAYCYIDDHRDVYVDVDDEEDDDTIDDIDGLIDAYDDDKTIDVTVVIEDGYVTEITGEVTDW